MDEAQGALEYLIIVAAVLGITAVIVATISGMFGSQKSRAKVSECQSAASRCKQDLLTLSDAPCTYCEDECAGINVPGNKTAVELCKEGNVTEIAAAEG